mgnify:CR=1 FL=1
MPRAAGTLSGRGWCFTINNYSDEEERRVHELRCEYLVVGRERGEQETPHLQGFVYFKNARTLRGVRRLVCARGHYELANGAWVGVGVST